jgi:hypothetical protein
VEDGTTRRSGVSAGNIPADSTSAADGPAVNGVAADSVPEEDGASAHGKRGPGWHRVVLKLSGQAFAGSEPLGICSP